MFLPMPSQWSVFEPLGPTVARLWWITPCSPPPSAGRHLPLPPPPPPPGPFCDSLTQSPLSYETHCVVRRSGDHHQSIYYVLRAGWVLLD